MRKSRPKGRAAGRLETPTPRELFEFGLEIHDVLLAGAVTGGCGIESEAACLIKVPFRFLTVREDNASADHRAWARDLIHGHGDSSCGGSLFGLGRRKRIALGRTFCFFDFEFEVIG